MVGQPITRIIPPELQHEETAILTKLRQGERIERYETIRVHKEGHRLEISLTVSPVRDSSGKIVGAAKIAHDITARRRAERASQEREVQLAKLLAERESLLESERAARSEAERLSHMKDEFLATLSHELRTPLNAIQGWAVLLRDRKVSAQDLDRGLETIERNVRVQSQIVNDLLDMSRIISGKVHLEVQPLHLHEVVNNAIETLVRPRPRRKSASSRCSTQRIGMVRGDPNRFNRCCGISCRTHSNSRLAAGVFRSWSSASTPMSKFAWRIPALASVPNSSLTSSIDSAKVIRARPDARRSGSGPIHREESRRAARRLCAGEKSR